MNSFKYVTVPLDKKEKKDLRHKWHQRLFILSSLVTLLILILAIATTGLFSALPSFKTLLGNKVYDNITGYVGLVLLAPFGLLIFRVLNSAKFSATGAIASKVQFEYVYAIVEHYSNLAGLKKIPTIAIVSDGDFLAKTNVNFGKAIILVHSDLLDAPRPDGIDWGALRFAIAREIGHIAAGHRNLKYDFFTAITQAIPYVSHPLKRAENLTADRYGAALAPDAAMDYFAVDAVSKDCYLDMSISAAVARAGQVRLGQMITGITGKQPPTVWRLQALAKLGIFRVEPHFNDGETVDDYREYLKNLPTLSIKIDDLKKHQAAFWSPPKPLPKEDVEKLCIKGTNEQILTREVKKS